MNLYFLAGSGSAIVPLPHFPPLRPLHAGLNGNRAEVEEVVHVARKERECDPAKADADAVIPVNVESAIRADRYGERHCFRSLRPLTSQRGDLNPHPPK